SLTLYAGRAPADDAPALYRGINLNGPSLTIDGHDWEAGNAKGILCDDAAFENQSIQLIPATDDSRAKMIRSSRWSPQGKARVRIAEVPAGTYSVYLYVWEDNDPQTFDISLSGRVVAKGYNSGKGGHWDRLGPGAMDVTAATIERRAGGGHANLWGIKIGRGKLTERNNPLPPPAPPVRAEARPATPDEAVALLIARNCLE